MFDDDEDHISESLILLSGSNKIYDDLSSSSSIGSNSIFSNPNIDSNNTNTINKAFNINASNLSSEYQHDHHALKANDGLHDSLTEFKSSKNVEEVTNVTSTDTAVDTIERHMLFLDKIDEEIRIILGSNRAQKNKSVTVPARDIYTSYRALSVEELQACISDQVPPAVFI